MTSAYRSGGSRPVLSVAVLCALLAGCVSRPTPTETQDESRALIERSLPREVPDRSSWVADIAATFQLLGIPPSPDPVCAVIAVTEQESGFQVDPVVPHLGEIARQEIDRRAEHAGVPLVLVHEVLKLDSPTGKSYAERIEEARTEKQLSDIFEDFTGSVPLGRTLFASYNPIRTRGPMQVNVAFADRYAASHHYPYPIRSSLDDELFTRRGSLYFGTAHLLDYRAPYDRYVYRFADFNAGQYASRNAAFQEALAIASDRPVEPDGTLGTDTELALQSIAGRLRLDEGAVQAALDAAHTEELEHTALYRRVFALAEQRAHRTLPRAVIPHITLKGPKIERHLTTEWYARRVQGRYERCLAR